MDMQLHSRQDCCMGSIHTSVVSEGRLLFGSACVHRGDHGERARACTLVTARIVRTGLPVARGDTVNHSERVRRSGFDWGCGHGTVRSVFYSGSSSCCAWNLCMQRYA